MNNQLTPRLALLVIFSSLALMSFGRPQVATAQSGLVLYDDFNNPAYDGSFNTTLWKFIGASFYQARQMNGNLIFSNATAPSSGDGDLEMQQPLQRSLTQLQQFEARLKISSNASGAYAFVKIQILSSNINGRTWWTQCRLGSAGATANFICDVYTFNGSSYIAEYLTAAMAANYDTWYTARIEANPNTANLRFYLNGTLVGSHTPNDTAALIAANNLRPRVGVWNDRANTYATRYVDDVRITQAGLNPLVFEARLDIGMPYNTNRGCPSPYIGCGKPFHGFDNGVCTDLVMDAYSAGSAFNIQSALLQDKSANPTHYYRWLSARNADDMRRYFNYAQQFLPNSQTYQVGDIAFFDWNGDGITDHVFVISQVDVNGRPLTMVDASGVYAGNPLGLAYEHSWNSYYDQKSQGHGRLNGTLVTSAAAITETLQVLRVSVNSSSVNLRLLDTNGKSTSATYDENLVASNIEAFIPYIPGGAYTDLGTSKVITVTQPLSNTVQYFVEVTGNAAIQYQLSMQTLQDGSVTASSSFTRSIALSETQGITVQLSSPGGVINFTSSTPTTLPKVSITPAQIQLSGLPGVIANTTVTLTEVSSLQAANAISVTVSNLMNQAGQTISGTLFTVTPSIFDLPAGGSQSVQLQIDLANLAPGLYQGSLLITSATNGTQAVPLSLNVVPFHSYLPLIVR